MLKRVHIIINPASGQAEPILTYINQELKDKVDWDIKITKKDGDAAQFAREACKEYVDIVAVYGGDGTVMEVAQVLCKTNTPLAIIPGGTANVMAKELGIPTTSVDALRLLTNEQVHYSQVDMGILNDNPFLIRVNIGLAADLVTSATRDLKDNLGQVAYSVAAIQNIPTAPLTQFDITMDDKSVSVEGIALLVANSGNLGIPGLSLIPEISPTDGFLDVVLIQNASFNALFEWVKATINNEKPTGDLQHWKAKNIVVKTSVPPNVVCDDKETTCNEMNISIVEKAIKIITP